MRYNCMLELQLTTGTRWLLRCLFNESAILHSKCGNVRGPIRREYTIECWQSRYTGKSTPFLIHPFITSFHSLNNCLQESCDGCSGNEFSPKLQFSPTNHPFMLLAHLPHLQTCTIARSRESFINNLRMPKFSFIFNFNSRCCKPCTLVFAAKAQAEFSIEFYPLLNVKRRFGRTCRLHLQGRRISQARNQRESRW
jgi:hypothetical protein